MKRSTFITVFVVFGLALFAGCASIGVWPDYERSAENKMVAIEERIGDGLKTGVLSPDQTQMLLTTLKGIRIDYSELRGQTVYQEKWANLHSRLDELGEEINRATTRTTKIEEPRNGERIASLQRSIDDGRISRRLSRTDERDFQVRLDLIRSDYLRMTEGTRLATYEEREDLSRRIDALAMDINRYR